MMMKQKWSDVSDEPISEEGVRAMHVPEELYSFDQETHPAGATFTVKAGKDFVLYLLNGTCRTTLDGTLMPLKAGEFMFLGKGAYHFKSTGTDAVRLVRVAARA